MFINPSERRNLIVCNPLKTTDVSHRFIRTLNLVEYVRCISCIQQKAISYKRSHFVTAEAIWSNSIHLLLLPKITVKEFQCDGNVVLLQRPLMPGV